MTFSELLDGFRGVHALVVGDLMLDEYLFGRAARISPEAPVMVVRQESTAHLPGGAANVARNLAALGATTAMLGVTGDDLAADALAGALESEGLGGATLLRDPNRPTTRKTRVLADHAHQVLRIDHETSEMLSPEIEKKLIEALEERVAASDVVVLSDYLKGVLTPGIAARAILAARERGIPVVANPKPRSLPQYRGASLISLNRVEAAEALGSWDGLNPDFALEAAETLRSRTEADAMLVTLGEQGMAVAGSTPCRIGVPKVEVYDTAGAGDTVIATVALGYRVAGCRPEVFELAAQTAACVIRHVGVATPSADDLAQIRTRER